MMKCTDRPGDGRPVPEWAFPSKSRCHEADGGCGSSETEAIRTAGHIQYRKCRRCGRHYKVVGTRI